MDIQKKLVILVNTFSSTDITLTSVDPIASVLHRIFLQKYRNLSDSVDINLMM
jgi:hypothetical protein